jgi:N-formylglutamate deformylase
MVVHAFDPSTAVRVSEGRSALVLDSPHSGTCYPGDFVHACPRDALRQAEDTHVDALWGFAPELDATLVCAQFPRTYIDANRALDDIDVELLAEPWPEPVTASSKVRLGKGLVWRRLDDGTPIYARPLAVREMLARIVNCWQPYHDAVREAVEAAALRHGHVVHLNCHSMPAVSGAFSTEFPWTQHADFVLGDRDGTTADPALTGWIERFLIGRGYTVSRNHPYKGVELVRVHGQPRHKRHSIQVEINKRLYMDEITLARHDGFDALQATLRELAQRLSAWDGRTSSEPA